MRCPEALIDVLIDPNRHTLPTYSRYREITEGDPIEATMTLLPEEVRVPHFRVTGISTALMETPRGDRTVVSVRLNGISSVDGHSTGDITFNRAFEGKIPPRDVPGLIRDCVALALMHEMDEHIVVRDTRPFNPHL